MSRSKRSKSLQYDAGRVRGFYEPLPTPSNPEDFLSPQQNVEFKEFLDDAGKTVKKFDLKSGFYTDNKTTPRHVVDEEDLELHRREHIHVHHPMSLHAKPSGSSKKGQVSKSHHVPTQQASTKKSGSFQPTMSKVPETENADGGDVDETAPGSLPPESSDVMDSVGLTMEAPTIDLPEVIIMPTLTFSSPEEPSTIDSPPVGFYIGEPHASTSEATPHALPEEEGVPGVTLQEILTGESCTDPHTDPGVLSANTRKGKLFKVGLPNGSMGKEDSKVTFQIGSSDHNLQTEDEAAAEEQKKHKDDKEPSKSHHRHHHHHRKHQSLSRRRHLGSDVEITNALVRVPTELDEAQMLSGVHLDDIASHRFNDDRGLRRRKHSTLSSVVWIGQAGNKQKGKAKAIDHSPHELFVELEELYLGENAEYEWQETARWIKFEEDVEADATRWGKPHVASLSFHSLLELRQCLAQGAVLLDLELEDLPSIINHVVDQLVLTDQLDPENKGNVIKALLLKHKHVHQQGGFLKRSSSFFGTSVDVPRSSGRRYSTPSLRRYSVPGIRQSLGNALRSSWSRSSGDAMESVRKKEADPSNHADLKDPPGTNGTKNKKKNRSDRKMSHFKIDVADEITRGETEGAGGDQFRTFLEPQILRRIPKGAEATTVLVGSVDFLEKPIMAFVRLARGQFLGNLTEVPLPVRFLFVLMGPAQGHLDYHQIGRSISTLMANTSFHDVAYQADEPKDLLDAINEFLDDSLVLPPGEWDKETLLPIMDMAREKAKARKEKQKHAIPPEEEEPGYIHVDPLQRTKRPFGGLVNDIRRRYPKYWSDIRDGLNLQCLATFFFIYFACLSPAITFGGLLSEKTDKWLGVSELLIQTAVSGILFALLSGQPLLIVGCSGPIIVFEEGLYQFTQQVGVDYMSMRLWVCLWVFVIAIVIVAAEGSLLVRYFTRFTMEIFASLISLIFIYEVFYKLYKVFLAHPLQPYYPPPVHGISNGMDNSTNRSLGLAQMDPNSTEAPSNFPESFLMENQPNTALLSVILTLGTFFIAYFLKQFRNSKFLGRSARRALGDFGIPIAILVMVLLDFLIKDTYTEKLDIPIDGVKPTDAEKRGWFINPLGMQNPLPIWAIFAAVIPAVLVFILIFMESMITGLIVSRKTKKGTGFHLDLLLIGTFAILSGFMGTPLMVVATVRSVSHLSSLSIMSQTHAPGERPKLIGVNEQRLTGLAVHILIGVSVLMGPLLQQIPLAVLFGVFLYMGIASMSGVQLFDRVEMLFMPRKHHPDVGYVKRVKTYKMHLYTIAQLVCLAILWIVKSTDAALGFPFFLVLMVPLRRYLLPHAFTEKELANLDCDDDDKGGGDEAEDELDFYQQAHMPV